MSFSFRNLFSQDESGNPAESRTKRDDSESSSIGIEGYQVSELLPFIPPAIAAEKIEIPMETTVIVPLPENGSGDVRLSTIYQSCPALFAAEITPLNDSVINLPVKNNGAPPPLSGNPFGDATGNGEENQIAANQTTKIMTKKDAQPASTESGEQPVYGFPPGADPESNPFAEHEPDSSSSVENPFSEDTGDPAVDSDSAIPAESSEDPVTSAPKSEAVEASLNPFGDSDSNGDGKPNEAMVTPFSEKVEEDEQIPAPFIPSEGSPPGQPLFEGTPDNEAEYVGPPPEAEGSPFASLEAADDDDEQPFESFIPVHMQEPEAPATEPQDQAQAQPQAQATDSQSMFSPLNQSKEPVFPGTPPAAPQEAPSSEAIQQGTTGDSTGYNATAVAEAFSLEDGKESVAEEPPETGVEIKNKKGEADDPKPELNSESPSSPPAVETPATESSPEIESAAAPLQDIALPSQAAPEPAPLSPLETPSPADTNREPLSPSSPSPEPEPGATSKTPAMVQPTTPASQPGPPSDPATATATAPASQSAPATRSDQKPSSPVAASGNTPARPGMRDIELRAVFSTDEGFTLKKVSEKVAAMDGVVSCAIVCSKGVIEDFDRPENSIGEKIQKMADHVRSLSTVTGVDGASYFTLHMDEVIMSFFFGEERILGVKHAPEAFQPGTREKLVLVARAIDSLEE